MITRKLSRDHEKTRRKNYNNAWPLRTSVDPRLNLKKISGLTFGPPPPISIPWLRPCMIVIQATGDAWPEARRCKYRSLRNNKKAFSNYWAFSNRSRHFSTSQSRPYGSPYRSGNALLLFLVFSWFLLFCRYRDNIYVKIKYVYKIQATVPTFFKKK